MASGFASSSCSRLLALLRSDTVGLFVNLVGKKRKKGRADPDEVVLVPAEKRLLGLDGDVLPDSLNGPFSLPSAMPEVDIV